MLSKSGGDRGNRPTTPPPTPFLISRKRLLLTPMNKLQTECDSGRETVIFVAVVVVGVCVVFFVFFFFLGGREEGVRGRDLLACRGFRGGKFSLFHYET